MSSPVYAFSNHPSHSSTSSSAVTTNNDNSAPQLDHRTD